MNPSKTGTYVIRIILKTHTKVNWHGFSAHVNCEFAYVFIDSVYNLERKMEFLAVVTILLALIDLNQLDCLVMAFSSVFCQRRRLVLLQLIEESSGAVHRH